MFALVLSLSMQYKPGGDAGDRVYFEGVDATWKHMQARSTR